jgi:hypothetical protein
MKICRIFLNLLMLASAFAQTRTAEDSGPHPRVGRITLDAQTVTELRLRPGYVSSVRLPEEISSVVLGDPKNFRAEHSEAEPRLVFLKPLGTKPSETNALITTKSGHEVSLHLVSGTGGSGGGDVDFFLDYERPRSLVIPATQPSFLIGDSRTLNAEDSRLPSDSIKRIATIQRILLQQSSVSTLKWVGKKLQVAVGPISKTGQQTIVPFSVLNNSDRTIELLPPQIQLAGDGKPGGKSTKAEQIPVADFTLTRQRLGPGSRADGVLVFERPTFKESSEQLLLEVAEAAQVDRPVLVPIAFTAATHGEAE